MKTVGSTSTPTRSRATSIIFRSSPLVKRLTDGSRRMILRALRSSIRFKSESRLVNGLRKTIPVYRGGFSLARPEVAKLF